MRCLMHRECAAILPPALRIAAAALLAPLGGCLVHSGGQLGDGEAPDLEGDTALETADSTLPDGVDAERDTGPDLPPDVPIEPPDVIPDGAECTEMWDPVCDDGNPCTGDWCDMVEFTCVHSGASVEGDDCPDDGNVCTDDFCRGGACVHEACREGESCPDDGNACTADVCRGGACVHPGTPNDGLPCAGDGETCTEDVCSGGACTHPWIPGCCHRDGDCLWAGHLWECDSSSETCYDPPEGHFCDWCNNRTDCGDGGSGSDDWCAYYSSTDRGCSTDCVDDYDCPRGSVCVVESGDPCTTGPPDCLCVVKVGTCTTWRHFGDPCGGDWDCEGPDNACVGGHCTWGCATADDCPPASTGCSGGFCGV